MMRAVKIEISTQLFVERFQLDTSDIGNVYIEDVHLDPEQDVLVVTLSSSFFPDVDKGSIPTAYPMLRRESTRIISWGIPLDNKENKEDI